MKSAEVTVRVADLPQVKALLKHLQQENERLRGWVEWIAEVKDDECRYDHHGYCQNHNLDERPCPMEGIHAYVAGLEEPPPVASTRGLPKKRSGG